MSQSSRDHSARRSAKMPPILAGDKSDIRAEFRRTGFEILSDVPWGSHTSFLYETMQDLINANVNYLKAGLEENESCLWIISGPLTEEAAIGALSIDIPKIETYLKANRVEIIHTDTWPIIGKETRPQQVVSLFEEKLLRALDSGRAGLRISGCPFCFGVRHGAIHDFERHLDTFITDKPMIVLCTHPLLESKAVDVLDLIQTHKFTVAVRQDQWQIVETAEYKQAKHQMEIVNQELDNAVSTDW